MKREVVEILLPCFRKKRGVQEDARIIKAVRLAKKYGDLRKKLERQAAFDASVAEAIGEVEPPLAVRDKLVAAACGELNNEGWKVHLRHPAILAVLSGMIIIGFFLAYLTMKKLDDFSGRDAIATLIERIDSMNGDELEAVDTGVDDLADWMAMNGVEEFRIPPEFASYKVIGRQIFTQEGAPIVQLAIENEKGVDSAVVILMLFRARDFRIDAKELEKWRIVSVEDWVSGVRAANGVCVVVTFIGTKVEMEGYLDGLSE